VEGLTVCPFSGSLFVLLTVLPLQDFEVTHPILNFSMTLLARLPDAFHHLVPNNNFHCQTPLKKKPNFIYFALQNASWQICMLRIETG